MAILDLISHVHLPSFVNMLPTYLKHSTFSGCFWSTAFFSPHNFCIFRDHTIMRNNRLNANFEYWFGCVGVGGGASVCAVHGRWLCRTCPAIKLGELVVCMVAGPVAADDNWRCSVRSYALSFVRNRRESGHLREGHIYFKNVKVHAAMKQKEVELWTCK